MPYTHFHDWSLHTHHKRPKGGRHYNNVRRRQRPWRIGFLLAAIALIVLATMRCEIQGHSVRTVSQNTLSDISEWREHRQQTKTVEKAIKEDQQERAIGELINIERELLGIRSLTWDDSLQAIAKAHSIDMATHGYFSHDNLVGEGPSARGYKAGYHCRKGNRRGLGENIYFGSLRGKDKLSGPVESWMESPGHRANMLGRGYSRAGIGIYEGRLDGYGKRYFTTMVFC